jgi:putative peptidoglycan lipid II flippase
VTDPSLESGDAAPRPRAGGRGALLVGSGILLSRLLGLVRERVFAHYFGSSDAADAFKVAFRTPNLLQNLFGEGALSASFIPVYAGLLARGDDRESGRVAGAVLALLAVVVSVLVLLGVLFAPVVVAIVAGGFEGEKRALTITLVRILFPGAGILVLSAWCLGVLNSHRRFFLSYAAPVVWNLAMIATLVWYGAGTALPRLAVLLAWGSVVGSLLQLLVQLPSVLRLARGLRLSLDTRAAHVRTVMRNFGPVFVGRGVVQISGHVDMIIATYLPAGSAAALSFAQLLYTLPVSLFGMSVSAAELPEMAGEAGPGTGPLPDATAAKLRGRLESGLRRIAFFIVPSAVAFLALGDVVAAAVYQGGRFTRADAVWVWGILAGSAVGLLASTLGRLYASTYYALHDTRTPLRFAMLRVGLTIVLGLLFAFPLRAALGIDPRWGVAGLTASAGIAGWLEYLLLRAGLQRRLGRTGVPASHVVRLWLAAGAGAAVAWGVRLALPPLHPIPQAALVLGSFGVAYLVLTAALGVPEVRTVTSRLRRR